MKLASYNDGSPDGKLLIVSRDLQHAVRADDISPTLIAALQQWDTCSEKLLCRYEKLNARQAPGAVPFICSDLAAPLPRAAQWLDGSAFPSHGERMVKAFNLDIPAARKKAPLMYQGCPDFLPPNADVVLPREQDGIDFEAELAVLTADVPMGSDAATGNKAIRLLMLVDDVSLRALQPKEMALGFGMIHSKPASVCSPVCVTPDELGGGWSHGKTSLSMKTRLNDQELGCLCGDEMEFMFGELIAHAAYTRSLSAGTVVGSGTFSNNDERHGVGCIAEMRAKEIIKNGHVSTDWLRFGDRVRIEMLDWDGHSVFGVIDHGYRAQKLDNRGWS